MHTEQRHSRHHGCEDQSRGPEMFYGYCHQSGRMRMMNYPDYMTNMQAAYSNLYQNSPYLQPAMETWNNLMGGSSSQSHHHHHGCGCHDHHHDCSCDCCIHCADLVEYARCGEVRNIPVTFDNDTRRERQVTLELGQFKSENGQPANWQASLSETTFTLPPCGEKTVILRVSINCGDSTTTPPGTTQPNGDAAQRAASVDSCKVAYASLKADGCVVRPLIIAVAVLPDHCGAHHAGCGCGCCCN
jgi:hypothetical protein